MKHNTECAASFQKDELDPFIRYDFLQSNDVMK